MMKKIIIMLGVVALAICSQAATAKWVVSSIYLEDGSAKAKASNTNYAMLLLYSSDTSDLGYTINGNNSLTLASTVSTAYSGALTGSGGTGTLGKTYDVFGAGAYYYIALFNSKGDASATAFDSYYVSSAIIGDPNATPPDTPISLSWSTSTANTWTPASVPEPTSGLLMLLGVAGLVLRRRCA
jgi:hypothetical protein